MPQKEKANATEAADFLFNYTVWVEDKLRSLGLPLNLIKGMDTPQGRKAVNEWMKKNRVEIQSRKNLGYRILHRGIEYSTLTFEKVAPDEKLIKSSEFLN